MLPTIAERRTGFATVMTRDLPTGLRTRRITLGGRPALEIDGGPGEARLLYLHGGGYIVGSPDTHAALTAELALRLNTTAVSLDYRLAPEHPLPAAVDDALAAYTELIRTTAPEKVLLAGDSAGGGLAIALLVAARRAGLPMPAAVATFSPFADLTLSGASLSTKHGVDPIFTRDSLVPFAQAYLNGQDPSDELASPFLADLKGLPPLLIQAGSSEVLLDDAVRLAARAGSDEVPVTLEIEPGATHVFQNQFGDGGPADAALDRAGAFLRQRIR